MSRKTIEARDFKYFKEARKYALSLPGVVRIKRTRNRMWLGNGRGHEPAAYVAMDGKNNRIASIWFGAIDWEVKPWPRSD